MIGVKIEKKLREKGFFLISYSLYTTSTFKECKNLCFIPQISPSVAEADL